MSGLCSVSQVCPKTIALWLMLETLEFGQALVTLVLDNEINCFSDLSDLIWQSVCIIQPNWTWELIGPKLMCLDKLVVNKFSHCTAVYQCFHCQWTIAVDHVDLDRVVGGPLKYLVFVGGTFKSNISLVDPTIQFSRTEKQLVEWGVSFTANPVKNPSLHLISPPFASPDH